MDNSHQHHASLSEGRDEKKLEDRGGGGMNVNGSNSSSNNRRSQPRRPLQGVRGRQGNSSTWTGPLPEPSVEPYICKLERLEVFSTNQCYYLIGCDKLNTTYRVIKMDRTLIERPPDQPSPRHNNNNSNNTASSNSATTNNNNIPGSSMSNVSPVTRNRTESSSHGGGSAGATAGTAPVPGAVTPESQANTLAETSHRAKPTLRPLSDFLTEDTNVYTQEEIQDMLDMIHDGNRLTRSDGKVPPSGGLKPIVKAYGLVGFIRFLDCYYLTVITRRTKVGTVGGNDIFTIKNVETIPLKPAERSPGSEDHADPSSVLFSMWNRGKRSVGLGLTNREIAELRYQGLYQVIDLTKNFYFSYTYDLTRSLQENFLAGTTQPFPPPPFKDMYAWNHFLTREFEGCLNSMTSFKWIMPIVHGAFCQRRVDDYGRTLHLILIARRSRHFAGTRYLKRGVSEQGKVANDVEHEQILHDESLSPPGTFSSYLQMRGSIPTFWTQESSVTMPKPPIELNRIDPSYRATQLHFEDLLKRYSSPILVLDLVKQCEKREREVRVGNIYRHAVDYINATISANDHKIRYCSLDYSHISKHRNLDVSASLNQVSTWAVNQTGFFCSAPKWKISVEGQISPFTDDDKRQATRLAEELGIPVFPMEQSGVLRTNCIDCLDRTNVAQFSAGVEALGQQLVVMGIRSRPKLNPSSTVVRVLIDMYVDIGDSIALQYGGSEAHKKVTAERSESNISGPIGKHKELLTSIRRYYSNAFTDRLKQDAMNLFLGYYLPHRHSIPLWELETDYYLHNFHVKAGRGTSHSMKTYERSYGVDWSEEDTTDTKDYEDSVISASSSSVIIASSKSRARSHQQHSLQRISSAESIASLKRESGESRRVQKVRNRCKTQNEALSLWWKVALRSYIKQRMWMHVGSNPTEFVVPRFERVHQPDKLGQFDRYFGRGWTTPVRPTHAAQHTESAEEAERIDYARIVSSSLRQIKDPKTNVSKPTDVTLGDFTSKYGYDSRFDPALKLFVENHEQNASTPPGTGIVNWNDSVDREAREEYVNYVASSSGAYGPPPAYREDRVKEFQRCLHDYTLKADDVLGIKQLAESAHLSEQIKSGLYLGLSKTASAIDVATAVHEQMNAFESRPPVGQWLIERELDRRGLNTAGVKDAVTSGLLDLSLAQKEYNEVLDGAVAQCRRSDLTTADSLKLYASMFGEHSTLSSADLTFLLCHVPDYALPKRDVQDQKKPHSGPTFFARRAQRLGIVTSQHTDNKNTAAPRFTGAGRVRDVPPGFEQINEDLFSRKDNKFMVFNGAGIDSWNGIQPITRSSRTESILLSSLE